MRVRERETRMRGDAIDRSTQRRRGRGVWAKEGEGIYSVAP